MKFIRYNKIDPHYATSLDRLVAGLNQEAEGTNLQKYNTKVDIIEEGNQFEIQLSVPGIKKEDLNIERNDGKLTVSGERKPSKKNHSMETPYGSFRRSFFLPDNIQSGSIEAAFENGVLKVVIPKKEKKVFKSTIKVK